MKVLYVTNMFPVSDYIYFGIHVKEQIQAIEFFEKIEKEVYFINGRANKYNYLKSIYKINSLIAKGDYDVVHIHFGLSGLFLLFNPFQKVPVVLTIHGSDINSKKMGGMLPFITKLIVKRAQNVIVMNDKMAAILNIYKNKITKIPCGVNIDHFKEAVIKTSSGKITIGFPGNKKRIEKNFGLFANIVERTKATANVEVIEFHNMTREEVVKNLNQIDLLLLTSISEGSPQIIKEAMACNIPIISTSVGDIEDLLKDVENCYVINSFDPEDFLSPISEIINLPLKRRKSNGRVKLVKMELDAKSVAEKIYQVYEKLL